MKNKKTMLGVLGACAVLSTVPAYADKHTIGDKALDHITGKANSTTISGSNSLTMGMTADHGSVQVGYYQWDDSHQSDASNHKGANDQSGNHSMVQENVTAILNSLAWGGPAQLSTVNAASVAGNQNNTSWWIMYLGGF